MKNKFLPLVLCLLCLSGMEASAAIRYVRPTSMGLGNGSSWANASSDLQLMIDQSSANDEVWVAAGFYKPTRLYYNTSTISLNNRDNSFVLKANVNVYGGFSESETMLSQRNWQNNQSILDGDIGVVNDSTDNCYSVVRSIGSIGTTAFDGFYIEEGLGNGASANQYSGGGMYIFQSSPTVANCIFINNNAMDGGAMYIQSGAPTITNCKFYGNKAQANGGAINSYTPGAYTINRCWFANNSASNGGAIANEYSQTSQVLLVKNSLFQGNYASGTGNSGGGAIYNYTDIIAEYINCTFAGNRSNAYGGAVFTQSASGGDVLKNCIVWGNTAVASGMNLLDTFGATATITYSIIEGGFVGTGNSSMDPAFANSRPASWAPTVSGDYKTLPCSPAISAGNNAYLTASDNLDYYGNVRIQNVNVDIGAFELTEQPITPDANGRVYVDKDIFIQGSGGSWGLAQRELAEVLRAAQTNTAITEIWVAAGIYYPFYDAVTNCAGNNLRDRTFKIRDGLSVYGGFAGTETSLSQRDINANASILDGDLGMFNDTSDNAYHVVLISNPNAATVDGFTIKNGVATGSGFINVGGTISSNQGAGIFIRNGSGIVLRNLVVENNFTSDNGTISFGGSGEISNCVFKNNYAKSGAALFLGGSVGKVINNCTFSGNIAETNIVSQSNGTANFIGCLFSGNQSTLNINYGLTTTPATLYTFGGLGTTTNITNCTFSGNYRNNSSTTLVKLISNNSGNTTNIRNSIIWGNIDQTSPVAMGGTGTGTFNISNSIVQGSAASFDPQFVNAPFASTAPFITGDYKLEKCSPAINNGNNAFLTVNDTLDLAANKRIKEDSVDMGAYEYSGAVADANGVVYVDGSKATSGDGVSWANAVKELGDALRAAKYDTSIHEVWVAKGTYKPIYSADSILCNPINNRDKAFVIPMNLKVYGGFLGNETTVSGRNFATNKTILSGDIGTQNVATDNSFHVVVACNQTVANNTVLDGFHITGGHYSGFAGNDTISVNGFRVYRNMGGGISLSRATMNIYNCIISGNENYYGGGICFYGHGAFFLPVTSNIVNTIISGNVANNTIYPGGGGLYSFSSHGDINVINSTITANRTGNSGGGVAINIPQSGGNIKLRNSIVWYNSNGTSTNDNINNAGNASNITTINCLVGGGYASGTNIIDAFPAFDSAVHPMYAPTTIGKFQLTQCSPAINAGDNNLITGFTTDIANVNRTQQNIVDLGTYENLGMELHHTPGDSIGTTNTNNTCGYIVNLNKANNTWRTYYSTPANKAILSILDTNNVMFSGAIFPYYVSSKLYTSYNTGTTQQLNNPFAQTGYYYPFNRSWTVTTSGSITAPVSVRFYISKEDSMDLAAQTNFGNLQNLIVYKVNGANPYLLTATGYKEYSYAATPDTNHFTVGTYQGVRYVEFQTTSFSSGTVALKTTNPLSIQLGDIVATNIGNRNRIDWNTLSEEADDKMMLERSSDGKKFISITPIQTKTVASKYSYWDETPFAGINYYRLRIENSNNEFLYSKIVSAFVSDKDAVAVQLYPNPVNDILTIRYNKSSTTVAQYHITDISGKIILSGEVINGETTVNVSSLAKGIYFMKYINEEQLETIKFEKM